MDFGMCFTFQGCEQQGEPCSGTGHKQSLNTGNTGINGMIKARDLAAVLCVGLGRLDPTG